uniref:(California timema) hypothetical protein n=1 Tax=Timema californicum TaxID=61474 RepID=A0A7R9P352_TIMCA|nr:unnamed protein product [Timema californicum]
MNFGASKRWGPQLWPCWPALWAGPDHRCSENTTEKLHIIVTILVRRITDELLLVECRRPLAKEPSNDESLRGPTDEEIKAATQHVEPKNISKQHPPLECTADSEIRKILISLVEASARILTPSPNADEVFAVIRERLESKSSGKTEPDILSVKQLVDMGFSEQQASEALRRNRMNQTEALDWLLEQQSDSASPRSEPPASSTVVASSSKYRHELVKQLSHTESKQQCVSKTVASLLESFRAFKRSDFKPNEKALKNLVEMGFSEQDVKDALHITGNNQSSATISDSMATLTGRIGGDKELMLFKKKRAAIRASFTKIVKTTTDLFSVDSEKDLVTIETNHQLLQGKSSELSNLDEQILNSLFESEGQLQSPMDFLWKEVNKKSTSVLRDKDNLKKDLPESTRVPVKNTLANNSCSEVLLQTLTVRLKGKREKELGM